MPALIDIKSFQLDHVGFRIGESIILEQVSLTIGSGEVISIIGQNGAGKSTLLKLVSGEYKPTSGTIYCRGTDLRSIPIREQARIRAVLPQSSSLHFPFRVHQVVMMGRSPHAGQGYQADQEIVKQVMQLTDTIHLQQRVFTTLSGGEKQRVHLARALAQIWPDRSNEVRFLLLDEPTSALDLAHQHQTLSIARRFAEEFNVGVLTVLHDFNLASYYSDRIAVLANGGLLSEGRPGDVITADTIEQAFNTSVKVIDHPLHRGCPLVVSPV